MITCSRTGSELFRNPYLLNDFILLKSLTFFQMLGPLSMSSYVCFPMMLVAQDTRADVTSKIARQIWHINNRIFFAPFLVKGCLVSGAPEILLLLFFRHVLMSFRFSR